MFLDFESMNVLSLVMILGCFKVDSENEIMLCGRVKLVVNGFICGKWWVMFLVVLYFIFKVFILLFCRRLSLL